MSIVDIKVPDIGDVDEVEVIEILVSVGDAVKTDDSLITLESDKASMEIPASADGTITTLSIEVGAKVSAGTVIGSMEIIENSPAPSEEVSEPESPATPEPTPVETPASVKTEEQPAEEVAAKESSNRTLAQSDNSPTAKIDGERNKKSHAGPGVRRYAREHGADLSLIKGTGLKDRILKSDVLGFIKQSMEGMNSNYAGAGISGGSGIPTIPEVDFTKFGEIDRVEMSRINRLSATNLHRAWLNVPMVTHHDEADITELEAFRKNLKNETKEGEPKITGLAFHLKALTLTLKAYPKVNSSLSPDGQALIYKQYFHIGIAVDTPNGLVVPVIRDVDKKSITELASDMADLSTRARAKKLKPGEMQGASMTISSLGGIGGTAFTPIVNPPEVAILGITRAKMQPVWNGSEFIPRLICPLDLSYDHRVVDGADAARFMAFYCKTISDIRRLLL